MLQGIIIATVLALTGLDQLTKWLAIGLKDTPVVLLDGVLELRYHENTGISFGMLEGYRWVVAALTAVIVVFVLYLLLSGRFRHSKWVNISGILIVAGGIGNLIDRLFRGYVIDFIYVKIINFPIFNVADCCVVIGAIALLFYFFFLYEDKSHGRKAPASAKGDVTDGDALSDSHKNGGKA